MRTAWGAATLISAVVFCACPAMAQGTLQLVPTDPVVRLYKLLVSGYLISTASGAVTVMVPEAIVPLPGS